MVVKTQANYILFLEDTYKKMNQDINQKSTQPSSVTPLLNSGTEYYITAGTKNIMKEITAEEVDQEDDSRHLTHPGKRVEVMHEQGISPTEVEVDEVDLADEVNSLI
jgi:hypothetical protein